MAALLRSSLALVTTIALLVPYTPCLRAEPQGVAGVAAIPLVTLGAGKLLKDIIGEFERSASRLIFQAEGSGSIVAARFGNELRVATRNAEIALERQLNQSYRKLRAGQGLSGLAAASRRVGKSSSATACGSGPSGVD